MTRSIIDASSTTTTDCGRGSFSWRAKRPVDGCHPRSLWSVCGDAIASAGPAAVKSRGAAAKPDAIACSSRCAALPVGAATATRSARTPAQCRARRSATTIVVFPVPGPPLTSARPCDSAARTAVFCSFDSGGGPAATACIDLRTVFSSTGDGRATFARTRAQNRSSTSRILDVDSQSPSRTRGLRSPALPKTEAHGPASPPRTRPSSDRTAASASPAPTPASAAASRPSSTGIRVLPACKAAMHAAASAAMARSSSAEAPGAQRAISHPR